MFWAQNKVEVERRKFHLNFDSMINILINKNPFNWINYMKTLSWLNSEYFNSNEKLSSVQKKKSFQQSVNRFWRLEDIQTLVSKYKPLKTFSHLFWNSFNFFQSINNLVLRKFFSFYVCFYSKYLFWKLFMNK